MIEPSAIAVITGIMVPLLAGLLYIIRAEIRKNTKTTDQTAAQMVPNHGTSLRDAIDRIERGRLEDRTAYTALIGGVHEDVREIRTSLENHVNWHLDKEH